MNEFRSIYEDYQKHPNKTVYWIVTVICWVPILLLLIFYMMERKTH